MGQSIQSLSVAGMPNSDVKAAIWLRNFAAGVARDPEAVRSTPEQSEKITALVQAFLDAYEIAYSPKTRTSITIAAKTRARNEAVLEIRKLANRIRTSDAITDVQRITLGLPLRNKRRRKRPEERRIDRMMRRATAEMNAPAVGFPSSNDESASSLCEVTSSFHEGDPPSDEGITSDSEGATSSSEGVSSAPEVTPSAPEEAPSAPEEAQRTVR